MGFDASDRTLLLLHDGELADVAALGRSLGARVLEPSDAEEPPADLAWDVLVASGRYAQHGAAGRRPRSVRIAVLERHSRALAKIMRRSGVDLVVRRPVHPAALRLLLLHALYRGPERRSRRVAVGSPVRFRVGLLKRRAVLVDLSMRGCLLITPHAARAGRRAVVWIPDPSNAGRSFAVPGEIVRVLTGRVDERGFAVDFGKVAERLVPPLKAAVAAHLDGPAAHGPKAAAARPGAPLDADDAPLLTEPRSAEAPAGEAECGAVACGAAPERRTSARGELAGRRVVALSEQAARVLIGRDLSVRGMRVDRTEGLALGQALQLAIHVTPGETPLVVRGEIVRDDGPLGYSLRFVGLSRAAERYLEKMVDSLPVLDGAAAGAGLILSEIVGGDS